MERSIQKLIRELLDPQPGERVLDIGCGFGDHLLFLSSLGLDVSGLDASPYMLSRAKERLGHRCLLRKGKAEGLPFEDNEFDLAIMINTLEFVDDPLQALREAGRVTNRRIFIGVMNSLSWHCLRSKVQSLFRESLLTHVRFYHLWQLKSYVQTALGPVPFTWRSSQSWPPLIRKTGVLPKGPWSAYHWPLGSLLAVQIDIVYSLKTENLALKWGIQKAKQSTAGGLTPESIPSAREA